MNNIILPERKFVELLDFNQTTTDVLAIGWNACLDEIARLNPCRAQAVADDEELKVLRAFYRCCASITDQLADSPKSALARLVEAVKDAAPSTQQKESGDE